MSTKPSAEMTWDEAESVMRQLEKELRAAAKANAAFRVAREADESVKALTAERVRLAKDIGDLREAITLAQSQVATDQANRELGRAAAESAHADLLAQRQREIDALDAAVATAQAAARAAENTRVGILADIANQAAAARASLAAEHAAAVETQRAELAAINAEHLRVETAVKELKATIAAMG